MKKLILTLILAVFSVAGLSAMDIKPKTETETVTYVVNMHCENCVNKLTDKLSFLKGVEDFKISLAEKTITIKFDPSKVQESKFVNTIQKLGYTAEKREKAKDRKEKAN